MTHFSVVWVWNGQANTPEEAAFKAWDELTTASDANIFMVAQTGRVGYHLSIVRQRSEKVDLMGLPTCALCGDVCNPATAQPYSRDRFVGECCQKEVAVGT